MVEKNNAVQKATTQVTDSAHTLKITELNGQCSIQDLGRNHAQHLGYCGSGAADEFAFRWANKLLGNAQNTAALELIFANLKLEVNSDCQVCITGAKTNVRINDKPARQWRILALKQGDCLSIEAPTDGLICYLAVYQGFQLPSFFDSCSQSINERHFDFVKTPDSGDELHIIEAVKKQNLASLSVKEQNERDASFERFYDNQPLILRFLPSELYRSLPENQQQALLTSFDIAPSSNRMGYRLTGQALSSKALAPNTAKLSRPVCYGTIQLPDDGQPIVLMKDRQTIGGYPVLGTVIQTDLFRLSQKRPGEQVKFMPITLKQAQAQLYSFNQRFE